jgi:hypothetical protein
MMLPFEMLVEGCHNREEAIRSVDASTEKEGLKKALFSVALLEKPFSVGFESESEATKLADRIRSLGFVCKVSRGPDPRQRLGNKEQRQ